MDALLLNPRAESLGKFVRAVQAVLFGRTLGNAYRDYAASLRRESENALQNAVRHTFGVLIGAATESPSSLAPLRLARLAHTKPHGAVIFLALDLANMSIMNPGVTEDHGGWVDVLSRVDNNPFALVTKCVELLAQLPH